MSLPSTHLGQSEGSEGTLKNPLNLGLTPS